MIVSCCFECPHSVESAREARQDYEDVMEWDEDGNVFEPYLACKKQDYKRVPIKAIDQDCPFRR